MQLLWQDLRFGARMLLKKTVFTIAPVITLTLCFAISTSAQSDRGKAGRSQASSNRQKTTREPADKQKDISPRLALLQKELKAGNSGAVESFWQEVAKQGTPLIEPAKGQAGYYLVTFLWRHTEETKSVEVYGGVTDSNFVDKQMTRLSGADLWFKTYRLRGDARFAYAFSINNNMTPGPEGRKQWLATLKSDPLNKSRRILDNLPKATLAELPDAPSQHWANRQADAPAGAVDWKKIKSAILNNERTAAIYTPPGYRADATPYGLLVVFDGLSYTAPVSVPTPVILDNLIARNRIAPMVAVILSSLNRSVELSCNPSFANFLAIEVVPWMRQNYNVATDPSRTIVAGASLGGLAATYAAFRHPEVFGAVLSQSGSFWWKPEGDNRHEWLTRQFEASPKLPVRFYLDVGLMERGKSQESDPNMLEVNRRMRDVLRAKGYQLFYQEFNGGHEWANWRGTFADGLLFLAGKNRDEKDGKTN